MTGVIPFGIVVGAASHEAGLSFWQSAWMNILVFAGASQLATLDLLTQKIPLGIVVVTGLIINLRFLLYSAAFSPFVRGANWTKKAISAYMLTDQSYAVMTSNESLFRTNREALNFYFGSCFCMASAWHASVLAGYFFGNISPREWSLDYAVPLSFIVLVIPTLKSWRHKVVALSSALFGVAFRSFPMNIGLLVATICSMLIALLFIRLRDQGAPKAIKKGRLT